MVTSNTTGIFAQCLATSHVIHVQGKQILASVIEIQKED